MAPYITFRDHDKNGELQYYILQRDFPHYIGLITEHPEATALVSIPIPGYRISVEFAGTLRGNFIPAYPEVLQELEEIYKQMAGWYYAERIVKDDKRYNKLKIKRSTIHKD